MDFERLGAFYLGRETADDERPGAPPLMYDARDLTTHAACIGMTGSGKTGLCIDLLEEAALDRVPAMIIDPKGDIANLLLTFPELRPEDFRPWVNPDDARRQGVDLDAFAEAQADLWRRGLADWGQDGGRIARLRSEADFALFTPGSDAGRPVSLLSSFAAPAADWESEAEYLRDRISGTVTGLLGLIGVEADPVRSREHILLANLFEYFWRDGRDLDVETLILSITDPPLRRLGVFDVDTFFPEKQRVELAMRLNALIASPAFESWLLGQPLDVPGFLAAPDGRPRHSIFYLAHLSDAERMFFVTLLLNQVITWMRAQPGTTSLRALLYMDEVFGFLPPVAEPPSKKPFLTLLKQARAYGLGVVLTTQNPVDLDYKALGNAGTWFIGKLQTERDKLRVLDGLEAASTGAGQSLGRERIGDLISSLDKRVFLLHNVHEDQPLTFQTRWALSYLRGPLSRDQVARLTEGEASEPDKGGAVGPPDEGATKGSAVSPASAGTAPDRAEGLSDRRPVLAPKIPQVVLPTTRGPAAAALQLESRLGGPTRVEEQRLVYAPRLVGAGRVHYYHRKSGAEASESFVLLADPDSQGVVRWDEAEPIDTAAERWLEEPEPGALFEDVPGVMNEPREFRRAEKDLADHLYRSRSIPLFHSPELGTFSDPGRTADEFRLQLRQAARERRDREVDELEERFAKRIARVEERLRRARSRLAEREADASARSREAVVSVGETVLGLFLGRRSSRAASSSLTKYRQRSAARMRAEKAEEDVEALEEEMGRLERELQAETAEIVARWDYTSLELEEVAVTPRRADVEVARVAVAWAPMWRMEYRKEGDASLRVARVSGY